MDLKGKYLLPSEVEERLQGFTADLKLRYGERLKSVLLYGSAARGDYIAGKSNLNLLVILTRVGAEELAQGNQIFQKYRKKGVVAPLFFTPEYIATSTDSFPMEFLDIKAHHLLLFGEDPLTDLEIGRQNLRLQCEAEIKGKLVRVRQSFLEIGLDKRKLPGLLTGSLTSFLPAMRHLLRLDKGIEVRKAEEVFSQLEENYGLDGNPFRQIWELKRDKAKRISPEQFKPLFGQYISQLQKLAEIVDKLRVR
jgi:hypothetical protein